MQHFLAMSLLGGKTHLHGAWLLITAAVPCDPAVVLGGQRAVPGEAAAQSPAVLGVQRLAAAALLPWAPAQEASGTTCFPFTCISRLIGMPP